MFGVGGLSLVFGLTTAWIVTRYNFFGKKCKKSKNQQKQIKNIKQSIKTHVTSTKHQKNKKPKHWKAERQRRGRRAQQFRLEAPPDPGAPPRSRSEAARDRKWKLNWIILKQKRP